MKTLLFVTFFFLVFASLGQSDKNTRLLFPDFTQGAVFFKDGTQTTAMLNYDTYGEQMIFKNGDDIMILASPELISEIEINGVEFEWLEKGVFLEKIDTAAVLIYKRNRNQLMSKGKGTAYGGTSNTSSVQPVNNLPRGYDKQATSLSINEEFDLVPSHLYYVKDEKNFKSLSNIKQIGKIYGSDKKELDAFVKSNKLSLQNLNDVIRIIEHCNQK
ncbi:MAG: hypothetical protein ACK5M7_20710 [Draconibacterium sp.]